MTDIGAKKRNITEETECNMDSIKSFDPSEFEIQSFHIHTLTVLVSKWVKRVHTHTNIEIGSQ